MQQACRHVFTGAGFTTDQDSGWHHVIGHKLGNALNLAFDVFHGQAFTQHFHAFHRMRIALARIIQTVAL